MHSHICQLVVHPHVTSWLNIITGGVGEVPPLQLTTIVSFEFFLAVPFKTVDQLFGAHVVGVEIKITIDDEHLNLSLVEDLGEDLRWSGAILDGSSVPCAIL